MKIKALREAAGLTQVQLAEKMGVRQSVVSAWETGSAYPRSATLPALAAALGCTISDLYAETA